MSGSGPVSSTRSGSPAKCFAAVSRTCAAVEKWMNPSAASTAVRRPERVAPDIEAIEAYLARS